LPTRHQRQADDLAFLLEQGINLILPPRDHIEPGDLIVSDEKGVARPADCKSARSWVREGRGWLDSLRDISFRSKKRFRTVEFCLERRSFRGFLSSFRCRKSLHRHRNLR
jgi:hypothetical protein